MKAVCIIGSPNVSGNTAKLAERVCAGLRAGGAQTDCFSLGEMNIGFCKGCKACYEEEFTCVQQDDFDRLMEALKEAAVVVVAAPSYWGDVPAQMKAVIDRTTPYCDTREARAFFPRGKKGLALAIRAGTTERENLRVIDSISHWFGHLGISVAGTLSVTSVDGPQDWTDRADVLEAAYQLGLSSIAGSAIIHPSKP